MLNLLKVTKNIEILTFFITYYYNKNNLNCEKNLNKIDKKTKTYVQVKLIKPELFN